MQDLKINNLLDNVMTNAANVCGNLTTIRTLFDKLEKETEELKKCKENLLNELNREATSKAIDLKNHQVREMALVDELAEKNKETKELEEDCKALHDRLYSAEELITELAKENEKLKVEVAEALAKRDYWQNLANEEAANAKKAKYDYEKELEGRFKLDEKSQLAILAGAYAIRAYKNFDDGVYFNINVNRIISWKDAEYVLTNMITMEKEHG